MKNSLQVFAQNQSRCHDRKANFWGIFTVIAFIWLVVSTVIMLQGCSDEDGPSDSDIEHCRDSVGAIEECFGVQDTMGITYTEALKKCDTNESFDSYDHCVFDCEDNAMSCDDFEICIDGC